MWDQHTNLSPETLLVLRQGAKGGMNMWKWILHLPVVSQLIGDLEVAIWADLLRLGKVFAVLGKFEHIQVNIVHQSEMSTLD